MDRSRESLSDGPNKEIGGYNDVSSHCNWIEEGGC